jgi:uncharacterized protein (TIGR04141 family)
MSMAQPRPPLQHLHVKLLKAAVVDFDTAVENPASLTRYTLRRGLRFTGRLYVAKPSKSPPPWLEFVQTGVPEELRELTNSTNAAVLLVKCADRIFALTFGHGRHLLQEEFTVPDFGLKTSLNALKHDSLRSLDTFTVEDQTVFVRAQASRASSLDVFGLDIGRDILRAITGNPRAEVPFGSVSGVEGTIAVSSHTDFAGLADVCRTLLDLYRRRTYRDNFSWVDNISRVVDPTLIEDLDGSLLEGLTSQAESRPYLAPPEPIDWQVTSWFAYTRQSHLRATDLDLDQYLSRPPRNPVAIEHLKRDRVFAFNDIDATEPSTQWPLYKCLVYEVAKGQSRYVLVNGTWFEVAKDFAAGIRQAISSIPVSKLALGTFRTLTAGRLEPEGAYNARVAKATPAFALLDKKMAKCRTASTPIEFCDILTTSHHIVHVKHRKGGSSSLSHLFAQARVSSEAFIADEDFRKGMREHLKGLGPTFLSLVPEERPVAANYTVVFAILGSYAGHPADGLPFFSQLNLVRTQEALASMGFAVNVAGVLPK